MRPTYVATGIMRAGNVAIAQPRRKHSVGVLDDVDGRADHERGIEAQAGRGHTVLVRPTERRAPHGAALRRCHRLGRKAEVVVAARLHLAHGDDASSLGDDVDLTPAVTHVSCDDSPAVADVPGSGEVLTPGAACTARGS